MRNIKEAFGENLRKLRKSRKHTIESLSEMLDITPRQLAKIESGQTFFTSETLCKISVALDTSLQTLFDFEWFDYFLYFDEGKYIRPNFKAVRQGDVILLKSLPTLKNYKIKYQVQVSEFTSFIINLSRKINQVIYVEYFVDKVRERVAKISPDGRLVYLVRSDEIESVSLEKNNADYYSVVEKIREFSNDKAKMEYIKTAVDSLENDKSREKLQAMITGMELSK